MYNRIDKNYSTNNRVCKKKMKLHTYFTDEHELYFNEINGSAYKELKKNSQIIFMLGSA